MLDINRNDLVAGSYSYESFDAGVFEGSAVAVACSDIPCEMIFFCAPTSNAGTIWIGGTSVAENAGFPIERGECTGWIPVKNAKKIYYICGNATDKLFYMVVN